MKGTYLTLVLISVALSGCDTGKKAEKAAAVDTKAIEQELKSIETAWVADYSARDIDKLAGHYSDDAAIANPGSALATDDMMRRAEIGKFIADPSLKLDFASDRVQVAQSGDLASTRGHFTAETTDPATKKVKKETGSYLTVWEKQADGSWKAVEDFVTPGPAAAQ
ncbi:DUF4440 domain-containing protein [Sphingomonas sp. G124]|uniref:DUF4440 domain-containing protein n=1 Tax=Sphingomonas cremea TaxID=2904799 RepID=A0A9X1QIJ0_9SPHN|nr:DUF4440 domain-containing protein [Sphingomonas cremea]MCF2513755.1 DUF4440 domain-containing protein [Sphingomonas cremea]